jgi:hypothetical protein
MLIISPTHDNDTVYSNMQVSHIIPQNIYVNCDNFYGFAK